MRMHHRLEKLERVMRASADQLIKPPALTDEETFRLIDELRSEAEHNPEAQRRLDIVNALFERAWRRQEMLEVGLVHAENWRGASPVMTARK